MNFSFYCVLIIMVYCLAAMFLPSAGMLAQTLLHPRVSVGEGPEGVKQTAGRK